ncbi:heavy metal-associated isoprenylated plant protein 22-like [Corylus avellana]|uniref:heavy metal-associated isoprenylated plant protein 22-like n=1 Tax=Corylus avellana TaxID=13451 RepID=UPI00286B008A|nr:heavy metal-associated isoprenylated plant protein 22-like [Corylus avellana]
MQLLPMEAKPNNTFPPNFCVLKVNINCCKACPAKLRKKLHKIFGVSSITVDEEKGQVIGKGKVDPAKLLEAIRNIVKKKAEILQYVKESPYSAREDYPVKNIWKTNVLSGETHEDDYGKVNPGKLVDPVKKVIGKTNSLSGEKHGDDSGIVC